MKKLNEIYKELIVIYDKQSTVDNILLAYRCFSFIVTLIVYYITAPHNYLIQKFLIMGGLILAYTTMTILYFHNRNDHRSVLTLSIAEMIENSIFLVISGGFASPFIWYFISTIFIAAVNLSNFIGVIISIVYFITASISTLFALPQAVNHDVFRLYINSAISYILVVIGILQLIRYAVKVEEKTMSLSLLNHELEEAKLKIEKTLKYSIEIYETVSIFNLHGGDNILIELLHHMSNLSGVEQLMFIRLTPIEKLGTYVSCGLCKEEEEILLNRCRELINKNSQNIDLIECDFKDKNLIIHYVVYEDAPCGVFALLTDKVWNDYKESDIVATASNHKEDTVRYSGVLPVFIQIAGIMLKKLEFDELEEQLLISEEQNRIANEIHDLVLQKLFAISCRLYVLSTSKEFGAEANLNEELLGIKKSIDLIMKELRETIYGFSWDKRGKDIFKIKLIEYIDEIKHLLGVEVNICIEGDTQIIRANQKHGLYRAICEAMNNAVNHGNAKHIDIRISISNLLTTVKITDDGIGFDYTEYKRKANKGLGLNNIYRIIDMLNGHIEIISHISGGTEFYMTIPCRTVA
jgi:signal transduction histidine kinase